MGALLTVAGVAYAWLRLFTTFQFYDDEGYFIVLVRHLLDGRRMYDDISTLYGPGYLFYRWVINGVLGVPLDTDGVRFTTLASWCACALLSAWLVRTVTRGQRFSGWFVLVAAGFTLVHLSPLAQEPGHPQDLAQLLLIGGLAAFVALRHSRAALAGVFLGLAVAGTVWTKVNLGAFFGVPILLMLLSEDPARIVRAARWPLLVAALLLPWILMRAHLTEGWAIGLGCVASAGLIAAFAYSEGAGPRSSRRELVSACAGFAAGTVLCVGFALLHGSSLAGLYRSIVSLPARLTTEIVMGISVPAESAVCALAALAAALFARWRADRLPQWILPAAELAFALFVLLNIRTHPDRLIPCALPFAWLVLAGDSRRLALRLPLVLCAPLQALQVFPISGSQQAMGTSLLVPIAVIALSDACAALAPALAPARVRLVLAGALTASLTILVTLTLAGQANKGLHRYANADQIPLRGVCWTRFDEAVGARARCLSDTIIASCDEFLSVRGDNSQYHWTGRKPLTGIIAGHWWKLLDERQQTELAIAYASASRPLVLDSHRPTDDELRSPFGRIEDDQRATLPFFQMLKRSFRSAARIGADTLCVRRDAPDPLLASCVLVAERDLGAPGVRLAVRWPRSVPGAALERVQIADLVRGTIVADSSGLDPHSGLRLWDGDELLFAGTSGTRVTLDRASQAKDLRLECSSPLTHAQVSSAFVRFTGANGVRIVTLPVVVVLHAP